MATGAELIAAERERQVNEKGWTAEKDDLQTDGEILECAVKIADEVFNGDDSPIPMRPYHEWPIERSNYVRNKYGTDHIRRLVIAGALIAAEIDRLLRAAD